MKFGITMFPTDYAINVADLGRAVEDHGFESLLLPEHTHIPTSRRSPWPGGKDLPREYVHTLDPFVALGAVAAVTSRLLIGTGVCLVIQRDPIQLAKEVASIDHFSGGRFLFGIGGGWNYEEMENHGTNPKQRWSILRERILAMKRIWTEEEAEFHGKFVSFDPIWSWPKPVRKPHPPILMGGNGAKALERIVEYADEWMPIPGRGEPIEPRIAELQALAKAAGRAPIPVSTFLTPPDPSVVEQYEKAGVTRCIFSLRPTPADEALPRLAKLAEIAKSFA